MEYKIQDSVLVNKQIAEVAKRIELIIININGKIIENQSGITLWTYKYVFQTIRCKTYLVSHEKNTEIIIMVDSDYINLPGSKKIITELKKELTLDSKTKIIPPISKASQKKKIVFTPTITKNKKIESITLSPQKVQITNNVFCSKCGTQLTLALGSENAQFIKCCNCDNIFKNPNLSDTQKTLNNTNTSNIPRGMAIAISIIGIIWIIGSFSENSSNSSNSNHKIQNSSWDASVVQVEKYLKHNLNDPNSYEPIEWSKVVELNDNKFVVRHKYRAKNGFGAYIIEEQLFSLDSLGNVIDIRDVR